MIPLANWLSKDNQPVPPEGAGFELNAMDPMPEAGTGSAEIFTQTELDEAYERGRAEERAAADLRLEQALEDERQRHAESEKQLAVTWARRCGQDLADGIGHAIAELQKAIEQAAAAALVPFLEAKARESASASLIHLIGEVLSGADGRVLEIRAPLALHEALSELLDARRLAAVFTESDVIEVVTHASVLRFADLGTAWVDSLRAGNS